MLATCFLSNSSVAYGVGMDDKGRRHLAQQPNRNNSARRPCSELVWVQTERAKGIGSEDVGCCVAWALSLFDRVDVVPTSFSRLGHHHHQHNTGLGCYARVHHLLLLTSQLWMNAYDGDIDSTINRRSHIESAAIIGMLSLGQTTNPYATGSSGK